MALWGYYQCRLICGTIKVEFYLSDSTPAASNGGCLFQRRTTWHSDIYLDNTDSSYVASAKTLPMGRSDNLTMPHATVNDNLYPSRKQSGQRGSGTWILNGIKAKPPAVIPTPISLSIICISPRRSRTSSESRRLRSPTAAIRSRIIRPWLMNMTLTKPSTGASMKAFW